MGNEQASRVVQAPGIKTNQDESARPPIVRYSIGDEDTGYFSENRKHDNAVMNAATERSSAASFQILPPKQAESSEPPKNVTCIVVNVCRGTAQRHRYKYSITARWKFSSRFINLRLNAQYLPSYRLIC